MRKLRLDEKTLFPALLALATACGTDGKVALGGKAARASGDATAAQAPAAPGEAASAPAAARAYATDADLPACDAAREGALAYVTATKAFQVCTEGAWQDIDLRGAKGDKGDAGADGQTVAAATAGGMGAAVALYKAYRASVFRAALTCKLTAAAATQVDCKGKPAATGSLGSAFLCAPGTVCTNGHVALCGDPCYQVQQLSFQALESGTDSVNADGTPSAPFFTAASEAVVKKHPTRDLVRVAVTGVPAGAKPFELAARPFDATVQTLAEVLSLSFPLGFQDLYTDVGYVDAAAIRECDKEGGVSGYGCPADAYDFSTTNDTDHGSSGSPLLDVLTGKVIGVTSAGTEGENANFTWAIDASLLDF